MAVSFVCTLYCGCFNLFCNVWVCLCVGVLVICVLVFTGTAVAQWLRCCATNRKVAGSIPDGVIGIFH